MNFLRSISIFTVALASLSFIERANAVDCKGDTRQEHHVKNYNFVTSSWFEDVGNRRRYISCVANLDVGSDLLIHWFIPGPYDQYVPDDEVTLTPRARDDLNARPVDGCIKFGSLGDKRTAEFMGTAADESRNNNDPSCGQKMNSGGSAKTNPEGLPADGWIDQIRIFFPSDLSNPRNSMLEVTGAIGIKVEGGSYTSFFDYSAFRYKDRPDGVVGDVNFEPVFPVQEGQFLAAYSKSNSEPARTLNEKGTVTFQVSGSAEHKWRIVEAYYRFFDKENRTLAAIPMPLFQDAGE